MPISSRALIQLCHRTSSAVRSGIDARRLWETEERHATGALKQAVATIGQHVASGQSIAEGMHASGSFFPPLLIQMVALGEQTGKLDEVLHRLGKYYENLARMRRNFWLGIAWPLFELVVAVLVIALVIFITGLIGSSSGEATDVLGWGLVGTRGALIWLCLCALVAAGIALMVQAVRLGWFGPQMVLAAMRVPVLGKCLQSLALSRLTWALALGLDSGMDARRAVALAIRSTQNPYYETSLPRVAAGIAANQQFHESFAAAGVFPEEFIQQLEVAEMAGTTTESMLRLAQEYEDRARTSMHVLTGIATALVMLLIFAVIIFAIFSLFTQAYLKPIRDALEMSNTGRL
jgi:type IV pilus assembly protein PilC